MEYSAFFRFAVDRNIATVTFYDAVNHRKSHTGTFTGFLGGEIGLENTFHYKFWDTVTGVAYRQSNIYVGGDTLVFIGFIFSYEHFFQTDSQYSAIFAHGMGGVGGEVHDDLVYLCGIGENHGVTGYDTSLDLDGCRQG